MQITELSIKNFRNFAIGDFKFKERTAITGPNGSGKTSLIEAIHYLSSFKSFRSAADSKVVKIGEEDFVVNCSGEKEGESFCLGMQYANSKKTLSLNRERIEKLSDGFGVFLSVVLSIYDKLLSHQYSIYRRKFLDKLISTIDDQYFENLIQYHAILKQKNNALKQNQQRTLIDTYSAQMSSRSEYIYERRLEFSSYFEEVLNRVYARIFGKEKLIKVKYYSSKDNGEYTQLPLLEAARRKFESEQRRKRTVCGVHLDDYVVTVDDHPISEFGSEGEKILLGITMKAAEIQLIYENRGEYPVIMVDDAFTELDEKKRRSMIDLFEEYPQLILTYPTGKSNDNDYYTIDLGDKR
ncbi:MAG: DNA replication and repair protein RecF [bacterium]|nr:DNA replication and repair protein RecF [bacterium]